MRVPKFNTPHGPMGPKKNLIGITVRAGLHRCPLCFDVIELNLDSHYPKCLLDRAITVEFSSLP